MARIRTIKVDGLVHGLYGRGSRVSTEDLKKRLVVTFACGLDAYPSEEMRSIFKGIHPVISDWRDGLRIQCMQCLIALRGRRQT
jgi:hypothetical protein